MKYVITINQEKLLKIAPAATLGEAALLDFLHQICSSVSPAIEARRITGPGGRRFTWVSFDHILADLPLLAKGGKNRITRHLRNIEAWGFIKTISPDHRRKYIALEPKIELLHRSGKAGDKSDELYRKRDSAIPKSGQLRRGSYPEIGTYQRTTGNQETKDPRRTGDKYIRSGTGPERIGAIIKRTRP